MSRITYMKSSEIRSAFLNFFKENGHEVVSTSSLVPQDDKTLLFTNAGMHQFKDTFLGREQRAYKRVTTIQKCVRAGGKHNDLENVGYTTHHHTFFEMLGNFSFGDYFKKEAIRFAWDFLTDKLQLRPKERLYVTVYQSDDEAYNVWLNEIRIPADKIIRIGDNQGAPYASDNFWKIGDTGPCGPCTEIFYDHGEHRLGGRPGTFEADGNRFIEIWNIVFMEYNRQTDGTMKLLPKPSVDTGMGLERIAAIMQGEHSNYNIDIFHNLLKDISKVLGGVALTKASLRVIADHIRASCFLISDGVIPSNHGRGYTLRRIIRRACHHGHKLGVVKSFFYKLVVFLVREMGDAYPDLKKNQRHIEYILFHEEEQFIKTLGKGMRLLEHKLSSLNGTLIPGEVVFALYDTYGFPVDLINDIARERKLSVHKEGFEVLLETQRERARASRKFSMDYLNQLKVEGSTEFIGYQSLNGDSIVTGLFIDGKSVDVIFEGLQAIVTLNATTFYPTSGGQVGDTGQILSRSGGLLIVLDTQKHGDNHLHIVEVKKGNLKVGDLVSTSVDLKKRKAIEMNHSATHLLHAALRNVLGNHVTQKGSLIEPDKLRFDFSHFEAVKIEELCKIESLINQQVHANSIVKIEILDIAAAKIKGAIVLFSEKYGNEVRVLSMGTEDFSVELCGGTHVNRTGDIGSIRILSECGISSGVRRIEAVTGAVADQRQKIIEENYKSIMKLLKVPQDKVLNKITTILDRNRELEKVLQKIQKKLALANISDCMKKIREVSNVKVLVIQLDDVDPKFLKNMVDNFKNKLSSGIVFLVVPDGRKFLFGAGVTKDLISKVSAEDLLKMVTKQVGGGGGGCPDFAQGGCFLSENLPVAVQSIFQWLQERL